MSYRYMRMIVLFDLPTEMAVQRREYASFRKHLIKSGFMMMQESVYCKILLNSSHESAVESGLRASKPSGGLVQVLTVTEKQFAKITYLVGESSGQTISGDERFIEL